MKRPDTMSPANFDEYKARFTAEFDPGRRCQWELTTNKYGSICVEHWRHCSDGQFRKLKVTRKDAE